MGDNIFDIIMDYSVNEEMNKILLENEEYIGIQKEIDEQIEAYEKSGLTKEQRLAVDRLITSHTESSAYYGRMTYKEGWNVCIPE